MTAMRTDFLEHPRWQEAIKRINRLDPMRRAIFDTIAESKALAGEEMGQYLAAAKKAADYDIAQRRLATRLLRTEGRIGLAEKRLDWQTHEADKAQNIGWANIGVSGLSGVGDFMDKRRETKKLNAISALYRKK